MSLRPLPAALSLLLLPLLMSACATTRTAQLAESYNLTRAEVKRCQGGITVAEQLGSFVGRSELSVAGVKHRNDCSGLVNAAYHQAGRDLEGANSAALFERARREGVFHKRKRPRPGDVAFFDNTHDRNGNRRLDDKLTHVAVVEKVADDGTITMVHKGGSGVTRIVMNLRHRRLATDESGEKINSHLRGKTSKDRKRTRYLAGELWRGFASMWRLKDDGA